MKVNDVPEHFLSRADWVGREQTVDRVIIGDGNKDVGECVVTWIPSLAAIRAVVGQGTELLVCHEPTFWNHRDQPTEDKPGFWDKLRLIETHDLVIVRIHDCWDRWPEIGIPWAWAKALGLEGRPAAVGGNGYEHRYDIEPAPFGEFAKRVAGRTAALGQPMVEVTGDPDGPVSKIGIGTGCGTRVAAYLEMGCDCFVLCDDGTSYWQDVQHAEDLGIPTITVNHATSEEPGMVTLAQYINECVDGLAAAHLPQGCRFALVG